MTQPDELQKAETPITDSIASNMAWAYHNQPATQKAIDLARRLELKLRQVEKERDEARRMNRKIVNFDLLTELDQLKAVLEKCKNTLKMCRDCNHLPGHVALYVDKTINEI